MIGNDLECCTEQNWTRYVQARTSALHSALHKAEVQHLASVRYCLSSINASARDVRKSL